MKKTTKKIKLPKGTKELNEKIDVIVNGIDFSLIKKKLMDTEEGEGWSEEKADIVEIEYKKFLTLAKLFPNKELVPSKMVDKFWHQHILDTKSYYADCMCIFGYFLHHYPYFGINGEEDKQNLLEAFDETQKFHEEIFGNEAVAVESSRCQGHPCHAPTRCACRAPGTCK